jgi:hypothetical protein
VSWNPGSTQPVTSTGSTYTPTASGAWGAWGAVGTVSGPVSSPSSGGGYYGDSLDNPEPGTILTLLGGMGALYLLRRRTERKNVK